MRSTDGNGTAYRTDAWGFGLHARYRLRFEDVEVGVDVGYRAFSFGLHDADAMNPEPGDAGVAGGAVDEYFSGVLGVVYRPSGL